MLRSLLVVSTLALAAVGSAPSAQAKCGDYAETLLTTELVGPDPRIIIEVYAFDVARRAAQFELVGVNGERVPLDAIATHDGMNQRQHELAPRGPLAPGTWTVRRVDDPPRRETHTLIVTAPAATLAAPPRPALNVRGSERQEFGCGPGENVLLDVTGDASLAYVMLVDTTTDAVKTGFVRLANATFGARELAIGHGMCSGEFELNAGTTYRFAVHLVGADGRRGPGASGSATYAP